MNPKSSSLKSGAFLAAWLMLALPVGRSLGEDAERFYRQSGDDPSWQEVLESGDLPRGQNSTEGVEGSRIRVDDDLLDEGPNARRDIVRGILIHTVGHSAIKRDEFSNWSRWYQEDGNTQVFRLFQGEESVRNSRAQAARIEAFSALEWRRGEWHEWVGTFTIIKPHGAAIFQVKNDVNDWALMLNMNDEGDLRLNHRRGEDKLIASELVGRPFHIRVRDNGHDYEVYFNGVLQGTGSYDRPTGTTSFRWGMYLGANEVRHDAMILVTGAGINPKDYDPDLARVEQDARPMTPATESAPEGIRSIPERIWTNTEGQSIRAAARYEAGADHVKLHVGNDWINYPLSQLSEADRAVLQESVNGGGDDDS